MDIVTAPPKTKTKFFSDGDDDEPPPEPAPPEVPPRGHSMQTMKKRPPDFVVTIDKNGDQKHEEYIPAHHQGMFLCVLW